MTLLTQREKRFEFAAPVAFCWPVATGVVQSGIGVARNIGKSGALIVATECPPPGTPIQMTILLPRAEGTGYGMKLSGEGIVVRLERERMGFEERITGFAASVQFYPEPMDASEQPSDGGRGIENTELLRVLQDARRKVH